MASSQGQQKRRLAGYSKMASSTWGTGEYSLNVCEQRTTEATTVPALTTSIFPLFIFPAEGHDLDKNPWHGKIKVRKELKSLEKYGGVAAAR